MVERRSPFEGHFGSYEPVEPLWPYGAVGYFYPIPAELTPDGKPAIGVRKAPIVSVYEMPDGWRITAITDGFIRGKVFDVDEDGESAECVPWDDDLENTYAPPGWDSEEELRAVRRRAEAHAEAKRGARRHHPSEELERSGQERVLGENAKASRAIATGFITSRSSRREADKIRQAKGAEENGWQG